MRDQNLEMARSKAKYTVNTDGLQMLQTLLRLLGLSDDCTGPSDVVFVAIDFENAESIRRGTSSKVGCQVGVAVLDTRQLEARRLGAVSCPDDEEESFLEEPGELITTYNFATGTGGRVKSKNFLFGKTVFINSNDIREKIESCIPQNRKIILVGHGLINDLNALGILKVNLEAYRIVGEFDTFWIAPQVSPKMFPQGSRKLRDLLRKLNCPYNSLHCAGNDANFTLRALLLLAAQACTSTHHRRREKSKFLIKCATTSSHYIGLTKQQMRTRRKEKQVRRERRETRRAATRHARAQRAASAELQNEDSILEEGDLLWLESPWYDGPRAAVTELQNVVSVLEEGDLSRLETPWHYQPTADIAGSESRDCVVKPWGLQWVMMHDQA